MTGGVKTKNVWKNGSNERSEISGISPDIQQHISITQEENMLHKESVASNPAGNISGVSNSNINCDHVPTFTDHVLLSSGLQTTSPAQME